MWDVVGGLIWHICRVFIYYCHGHLSPSWRNSFVSLQLGELVEYTVRWGSVQSTRTKSCYWPAVGSCYPACREAFRTSQAPATKLLGHQCTPHSVMLLPFYYLYIWDLVTWWDVCFLCLSLPSARITPRYLAVTWCFKHLLYCQKLISCPVGSPAITDLLYNFSFWMF